MKEPPGHAIGSWQTKWAGSVSHHLIGQQQFDPKSDWLSDSLTVGVSLRCGGNRQVCTAHDTMDIYRSTQVWTLDPPITACLSAASVLGMVV